MSRLSNLAISQGATHYWTFDEASAPFNDLVGTLHLTNTGGTITRVIPSVVGSGQNLTSSGHIRTASTDTSVQFTGSQGFSYTAIVRPKGYTNNGAIITKRSTTTTDRVFGMFFFGTGTGTGLSVDLGTNQVRWSTNYYAPLNEWVMLTYTYSPSPATGKIYINGQLSYTNVYSTLPNSTSGVAYLTVGAYQTGTSPSYTTFFDGDIDDIALFEGKTLSAAEVLAQYATAFPITRVYDGSTWLDADRKAYNGSSWA